VARMSFENDLTPSRLTILAETNNSWSWLSGTSPGGGQVGFLRMTKITKPDSWYVKRPGLQLNGREELAG